MKKKGIFVILILLCLGVLWIYSLYKSNPETEQEKASTFDFQENLQMNLGDKDTLKMTSHSENIEHTELFYGDSLLASWDGNPKRMAYYFNTEDFGIGTRKIRLVSQFIDGSNKSDTRFLRITSDIVPELYKAEVIRVYPHNTASFTQGLEFYQGNLFEGTGQLGQSMVAEIDLTTGTINNQRKYGLDPSHFGEGITILDDIIYQLTWQNNKCFTYDLGQNIVPRGEFYYPGEGWGLCNNGKELIMSDGTERITFRDPASFTTNRTIDVYNNVQPVVYLNELEYIDSMIYANVWQTNTVVVIDPTNGKVLKEIDCSELIEAGKGFSGNELNGIAIDRTTGKIYMTGKNWEKLIEVRFVPKPAV